MYRSPDLQRVKENDLMTLASHPPRSRAKAGAAENRFIVLSDGRRLSYAEFGAPGGVPVFGFHGTPGSRFMFRLVHEPARRIGLRIIAPERPGFGHSTYQHNRTLAGWASDAAELATRLGIGQFAVAGISGGGPYAAACAALLPGRVTAAALISPMGPVRPPEGPEVLGTARYMTFRLLPRVGIAMKGAFSLGRLLFLNAPDSMYGFILRRAGPADRRILSRPEIRRNLLDGVSEGLRPGIRGVIQEMRIFCKPWELPFESIQAPVLLWQGTQDRNVPVAASFQLAGLIPGCEVFRLEGAGHYWIFEHIEEVLKAMMQILVP
jgi:pimeloyl-ACP methyl ester carboxylesterase